MKKGKNTLSLLLGFLVAFLAFKTPIPQPVVQDQDQIVVTDTADHQPENENDFKLDEQDVAISGGSQFQFSRELEMIFDIEFSENDEAHTFTLEEVIQPFFNTLFRQFIAPNAP